jgi:prevent-host-death family protein
MKKPSATDSIAVADLSSHVQEVLRKVRETGEAVVITENGEAAAVLVSPADFDWLDERRRLLARLEEAMEDERAGRLIEHEDLVRSLDEEFGPLDSAG